MRDVVVVITKLERCFVIVRGVPDNVKDAAPKLLERAMQARGKDWETDDVEVESVATVAPDCDDWCQIEFVKAAAG
jgi:hypothetical protein